MTDLFQFVAARQTMDRGTTVVVRADPEREGTQRLVERIADGLDAPRYDITGQRNPDDRRQMDQSDLDIVERVRAAEYGATMVVEVPGETVDRVPPFIREIEKAIATTRWKALTWLWVLADPPEVAMHYADIEVRPRLVGEVYRLQRDDYGDSLYMLSMEPVTVGGEPDG